MKARLARRLAQARAAKRKLFCAFVTLGYPDVRSTGKLIQGFASRGVDIVELGFPFSDPLADGPTIQFSSEAAIKRGVTLSDAFRVVRSLRKKGIDIPIIFFSYLNPIYRSGEQEFPRRLRQAGFDGLIVPDCPPEEDSLLWKACRREGIAPVFLIAPTTSPERARKIFARSQGFLYYVSLRGVTGARKAVSRDLVGNLRKLRRLSRKPILVGFGVSTPAQARRISRFSDGLIVGSAIVDKIRKSNGRLGPALSFVQLMTHSLRKGAEKR